MWPYFKIVAALLLLTVQSVVAQQNYVRLVRDSQNRPKYLQTAVARFQSPSGEIVDLVSVVHIADEPYYQKLNKHLDNYDAVLYEMVLDMPRSFDHQNEIRDLLGREKREPRIDTRRGGNDALSLYQKKMASVLGLEFQQSVIDYTKEHFYHADLTQEEFDEAMTGEKGESAGDLLTTLFEKSSSPVPEMIDAMKLPLLKIVALGPSEKERKILKIGVGASLAQAVDPAVEIQGDVLIGQRNARAMEVLKRRLAAGDKKFAIFYGAAHMPDISLRLRQAGYKPIYRNWMTCWVLEPSH